MQQVENSHNYQIEDCWANVKLDNTSSSFSLIKTFNLALAELFFYKTRNLSIIILASFLLLSFFASQTSIQNSKKSEFSTIVLFLKNDLNKTLHSELINKIQGTSAFINYELFNSQDVYRKFKTYVPKEIDFMDKVLSNSLPASIKILLDTDSLSRSGLISIEKELVSHQVVLDGKSFYPETVSKESKESTIQSLGFYSVIPLTLLGIFTLSLYQKRSKVLALAGFSKLRVFFVNFMNLSILNLISLSITLLLFTSFISNMTLSFVLLSAVVVIVASFVISYLYSFLK